MTTDLATIPSQEPVAAILQNWTQSEAIALASRIESVCPEYGCHVALTGGLLYKEGQRKDCDFILYRIRQVPVIDLDGLWIALETLGVVKQSGFGWSYKAEHNGKRVDFLLPEEHGGEYDTTQPEQINIETK